MKSSLPAFTLVGFFSIAAITSQGAVWVGGNNGNDWNTGSNWSTSSVPNGVIADFTSGTAVLSSPAPNILRLRLGGAAGNSGTVIISSSLSTTAEEASEVARQGTGTIIFNSGANFQSGGTFRLGILAGSSGVGTQNGGTVTSAGVFGVGVSGTGAYTLSGGAINALTNATIGQLAGGTGTYTQTSGTLTVGLAGSGGSFFVGQQSAGTFVLSGGKVVASAITVAGGVNASGTITQSGGEIDLVNGPTPSLGGVLTVTTRGSYSISNGSLLVTSVQMGGDFNISGDMATITVQNDFGLASTAEMNFTFSEIGITRINIGGNGLFDPAGTITVDGSAFTGPNGVYTLIDALSFNAAPVINLVGFEAGTTYDWNLATGNFSVTVVPEPSSVALALVGALGLAAWYRRRA